MAKNEVIRTKDLLFSLLRERNISVDKIVVFGSYARNTAKADSDIDIIIVSKDFRGKGIFKKVALSRGMHSDLVRKINMPVDLMYYSDTEWKNNSSLMIATAKHEGLVFNS
jgi:predicted nucleotidyltransferase